MFVVVPEAARADSFCQPGHGAGRLLLGTSSPDLCCRPACNFASGQLALSRPERLVGGEQVLAPAFPQAQLVLNRPSEPLRVIEGLAAPKLRRLGHLRPRRNIQLMLQHHACLSLDQSKGHGSPHGFPLVESHVGDQRQLFKRTGRRCTPHPPPPRHLSQCFPLHGR